MTRIYPDSSLQNPGEQARQVGSFWAETYDDVYTASRYLFSRARAEEQAEQNLSEARDSLGRFSVPVGHTDVWRLLILSESEMNSEQVSLNRYGTPGMVYGPQPATGTTWQYGQDHSQGLFSFPLDSPLLAAPLLLNGLRDPSLAWSEGLDYILDSGAIRFRQNPFENDLVARRDVYDDLGAVVDREAALWVCRAKLDQQLVASHHGWLIDTDQPDSDAYKGFVNAALDSVVEGGHLLALTEAISHLTDVPVVRTDGETVQTVLPDLRNLWIVTDRNAYRFHLDAEAVVTVGDTLQRGDQLANPVAIHEFQRGETPDDLLAVSLAPGYLATGYLGSLTFENKSVPLVVDVSGAFTRVSFEIGGLVEDVEKFWDDLHERGIAAGETLAHLLDQRTNQVGEPTATALPVTVNPLQFLVANVLRGNAFVVRLRTSLFGENALPFNLSRRLRRMLPPHVGLIVMAQIDLPDENIIMDGPGDATSPGYDEELNTFSAATISEDVDPAAFVSESLAFRHVDGVCA